MTATLRESAHPRVVHLELRPLDPTRTLVRSPDGTLHEVALATDALAEILAQCDGRQPTTEIQSDHSEPHETQDILTALAQTGGLAWGTATASATEATGHLLICHDDPLFEPAVALLQHRFERVDFTTCEALLQNPPANAKAMPVLLSRGPNPALHVAVDDYCQHHGLRWASFHLDEGCGLLGPLIVPGRTACYRDLLDRRRCSGDAVEAAQLEAPLTRAQGAPFDPSNPGRAAFLWMLGLFFEELARAVQGETCRLYSAELIADPSTWSCQAYHFLPMPTRPTPSDWLSSAPDAYAQLVNPRSGVVLAQHRVTHHPSFPPSLITIRSHCCDISQAAAWENDAFVGGSAFNDPAAASGASLGEAVERYCGNFLPKPSDPRFRKASYRELCAAGEHAVDPEQLVLHAPSMLATPGCPFVPFTRDLNITWVAGRSLTQDRPAWLPLAMTYANWMGADFADEPLYTHLYTPGMAGGRNLEEALVGAVRELVERDITMAWWLNGVALPGIALTPELNQLLQEVPPDLRLDYRLIHLDNPFGIPVFVGIVEDKHNQLINIGFGCRPDPVAAATKAWSEALTLLEGSRDLLQPDSLLRRSAESWGLLQVPYRPYRADRRYCDSFDDDYRDITDLMLQQQFFLDPRAVAQVRPLLDTPATRFFADLPSLPDNRFETYRRPIEDQGFEIFYADITSADIALTGMRAVRVIIPGLIPNMPAAFPAAGGARVFELPVQMGWRTAPLHESQINRLPMPHA